MQKRKEKHKRRRTEWASWWLDEILPPSDRRRNSGPLCESDEHRVGEGVGSGLGKEVKTSMWLINKPKIKLVENMSQSAPPAGSSGEHASVCMSASNQLTGLPTVTWPCGTKQHVLWEEVWSPRGGHFTTSTSHGPVTTLVPNNSSSTTPGPDG